MYGTIVKSDFTPDERFTRGALARRGARSHLPYVQPTIPPRQPTYIRAWREARGMSVERLAASIGSTNATVSRVERALVPYGQDLVEKIAEALDVSPSELLFTDPARGPSIQRLLDRASPEERARVVAVAETMLGFVAAPQKPDAEAGAKEITPGV